MFILNGVYMSMYQVHHGWDEVTGEVVIQVRRQFLIKYIDTYASNNISTLGRFQSKPLYPHK